MKLIEVTILKNVIINGVENPHYFIDECGNVYNSDGKLMKNHLMRNGYYRVRLSKGTKRGLYLVHRLVAETYIPNPQNLPIVNHKNSNRGDNRVSNLEWADNSKNQKQRFSENGYKGTKRKKVVQIDLKTGEPIKIWDSPIDVFRELGIANQNISKVCRGERKQAGGFGWKYLE